MNIILFCCLLWCFSVENVKVRPTAKRENAPARAKRTLLRYSLHAQMLSMIRTDSDWIIEVKSNTNDGRLLGWSVLAGVIVTRVTLWVGCVSQIVHHRQQHHSCTLMSARRLDVGRFVRVGHICMINQISYVGIVWIVCDGQVPFPWSLRFKIVLLSTWHVCNVSVRYLN